MRAVCQTLGRAIVFASEVVALAHPLRSGDAGEPRIAARRDRGRHRRRLQRRGLTGGDLPRGRDRQGGRCRRDRRRGWRQDAGHGEGGGPPGGAAARPGPDDRLDGRADELALGHLRRRRRLLGVPLLRSQPGRRARRYDGHRPGTGPLPGRWDRRRTLDVLRGRRFLDDPQAGDGRRAAAAGGQDVGAAVLRHAAGRRCRGQARGRARRRHAGAGPGDRGQHAAVRTGGSSRAGWPPRIRSTTG